MSAAARLRILTEPQVERIREAAFEILARTGIEVVSETARAEFQRAGAQIHGQTARLERTLVETAVAAAPDAFTLHGRAGDRDVANGAGATVIQPMIGRLHTLDADGTRRRTSLADVVRLITVADALPNYHLLHSGGVMPQIEGVPDGFAHIGGYVAGVRASAKPIKASCRGRQVALDGLELAEIVAGGTAAQARRPNVFTTFNMVSPLQMPAELSEGLIEFARRGMPVDVTSEPQLGATAPVSQAGALALQTAEVLAGIVLAQLVRRGTPVWMGTCGAALDMRHTTIALGGVEAALLNAAHAQIAASFGIPSRTTGAVTNSKVLDAQAGFEKTLTLLAPVLVGADMIFYPGTVEHAETVSLASLVFDHELSGAALFAARGCLVDDDRLAVDLIDRVGPAGSYLGERHTATHMFTEQFFPAVSDRRRREEWQRDGALSAAQRAQAQADAILESHIAPPVEAEVDQALDASVRAFARRPGGDAIVAAVDRARGAPTA